MVDYTTGLARILDEPVSGPPQAQEEAWPIGPNGVPRITVTPSRPAPPITDEARGNEGGVIGSAPITEQPASAPLAAPQPMTLHPVDHEPQFHIELHPVDYTPEFVDEPSKTAVQPPLSDEQMRILAAQVKGGALQTGNPRDVATSAGQGVIQGYKDYFDPWAKNDQGYVADQPLAGPHGKTPEIMKSPMVPIAGGLDLASQLIMPGAGGAAKTAMFLGAGARGADLAKLAKAQAMEGKGYADHIIRQITGWFKGADHQWRFEIPDQGAQWLGQAGIDANKQVLQQRAANLYAQRDQIYDVVTGEIKDQQKFNELNKQITDLYRQIDTPTMGMALNHPELYAQYPHTKDIPLSIRELRGAKGEYHPERPADKNLPWNDLAAGPATIALDTETGANKSVALHELQHDIQGVEGFARGGSYSTPEVAAEAEAQVGKRRADLLKEMDSINKAKMNYLKMTWGYTGPEDLKNPRYMQMANTYWERFPDEANRVQEILADSNQLNAAHQRALRDAYKRLAGEVESRNVQARADMSPSELARREPFETEDVPRDRQIVIPQDGKELPAVQRSMDESEAAAERVNQGLHEPAEPVKGEGYGTGQSEAVAAEAAGDRAGRPGGDQGLAEAQRAAAAAAGSTRALEGLPSKAIEVGGRAYVPGPIERVHQVADKYMKDAGLKYEPLRTYQPVKESRAKLIATAYEKMKHAPDDPAVKKSYDAMIKETTDQLKAVQDSGLKIEFIKPGMKDPYEASPRLATMDVRDNNHLWVFPTEGGFGSGDKLTAEQIADNPLLRDTGIVINGHKVLANDAFRIVHDYFGHIKDGFGFRAAGEENAWRSHSRMYSPLAREAMTSETRGQNSWLNYGPHGEKNRTAKSADTVYADQKTGIMPRWTHLTGAADPYVAPVDEAGKRIINAGIDAPKNSKVQTVADPYRMMYPGIYEDPRKIASDAAERVAPEDMMMKRLWGTSRGDLDEMAKGRIGNREPDVYEGPRGTRGSLSAQNIQTPRNTERIQDILHEAGKKPGLKHADAWYIMDPVYKRMEQLFGPEEAKARFERFNTMMGLASPGSEVLTEIQRGSAANMMNEKGRFGEFFTYGGKDNLGKPPELESVDGHLYHGTSHAKPMQKYLDTGKIQSKEAKVPAYVQASGAPETGFQTKGPVGDSHFSRGVGLADTRKGPSDVASSVSAPEYHTLQPWWMNEVAAPLGMESVPAQARLWTALGPRTGVESALGQGKLELLTKQIVKAAKRLGITPEAARDLILSGKAHAGAIAGGAVAGGVAQEALHNGEQ